MGAPPSPHRLSPLPLTYAKPAVASQPAPLAPQYASSLGVGWGGSVSRSSRIRK